MEFIGHFRRLTPVQRNTFIACFLGWSLDAFDFFILTFALAPLRLNSRQKFRPSRKPFSSLWLFVPWAHSSLA
jgi:hypothetical protein